ncbi:PAS domain S-box protein [Desulfoluna spongiiphila]|uniref:PAS domain S-box protein n=1 Tax=Desulfoluna spongiiphila TaxID=419481 RepID=UPI00125C1DFE|nr:PAS domain S-box protein [Desulfoluna spongiiphila]VVS91745.1 pas fold-4 [Desulfoluna spongiiphila]
MKPLHSDLGKQTSLRSDFIYAFFMVLGVTCIIVTIIDCYMVYSRNTRMLEKNAGSTMERAVKTLEQPLWHYDVAFIRTFAEILANDRSLVHVEVFDEQGKTLVVKDRAGDSLATARIRWELERTVSHNGKSIGRIVMTFTNSDVWMLTQQMIFSDLAIMFSALFAVLGTTWILLNRQILKPLGVMEKAFHRISAGDYSRRVRLRKNNELSVIAYEFNTMVEQVALRDSKIRESETKYRNLVEGTTDIIFRTNLDGCLVYMNQNFEKWTGFQVADFLGKPFFGLLASGYGPDDFHRLKQGVFEGRTNLHEIRLTKADGTLIYMELNITIQKDFDGTPMGAMGIARDITRRKHSEDELRKYEQMVAASSDCMWLVDGALSMQAVNKAYLQATRRDRAELINRPVAEVLGDSLFAEHVKPYLEACLLGKNVRHRAWVRFPKRGLRFVDFTFYPSFDSAGAVSGVVVNERDLTEQKTLETKLQQSQKMEAIGTLAGGIAHDFNNILGGIIGYAEMVEMFDVEGNDRVAVRIEHILKGAYRARELVDQILTFSRHGEQEKSLLALGPIVKESLKFLRASIPSTIRIEERVDCPNDAVMANATQMHQVLMNLCTNASYAMQDRGGTLTVSLCEVDVDADQAWELSGVLPGPHVQLSVIDTGPGIEPELMDRIFDPFFTTKQTGDGTGMGLAVVHGIVKHFNGAVTVRSTPGEGTAFHILIPAGSEAGDAAAEEARVAVSRGRGKILFVDDEEELVSFSSEILSHLGYDVVAETSSIHARRRFMQDPSAFDLVITDQTMPEMTGFDLALEVMAVRPELPVVLCTGFSSSQLEEEARAAGIRSFMKKPIGARQLADLVTRVLHREPVA